MPRLPTVLPTERDRLGDVWGNIGSLEEPAAFFDDLSAIIKVRLTARSRIRIAEAIVGYRSEIKSILAAEEVAEARRLVKGVRREIADLQKCTARIERQLASAKGASRRKIQVHAGRECWAIYQNAKQHSDQLKRLLRWGSQIDAGLYSIGLSNRRLAEIDNAVREAIWKIAPPFRHWHTDCDGALAILDHSLDGWADSTKGKGQVSRSKALSSLIERLRGAFEEVTGRSPKGRSSFQSFLKRILAALPSGVYNNAGDAALPARVRRLVS